MSDRGSGKIRTEVVHGGGARPIRIFVAIFVLFVVGVVIWAVAGQDPAPPSKSQKTEEQEIIDRLDTLIVLKCRELDTIGADSLTQEEIAACG